MSKISQQNKERIQEQILFYLYKIFPKQVFISEIAKELVRDEEFIKDLLFGLLKKEMVIKIDKNPKGIKYSKELRWRISNKTHEIYSKHQ